MNKQQHKKGVHMKKILMILVLVMLALVGCSTNSNPSTPGYDINNILSLSYQSALKKEAVVCVEDTTADSLGVRVDSLDINFGCFFNSRNYYAVLNNNSDYTLTDVVITSSNPAFVVTPSNIASIGAPGKSSGMTPIVSIAANHGSALNNQSIEASMPRGLNYTTITITGKVNGENFEVEYLVGGTSKTIELYHDTTNNTCVLNGPVYTKDGVYHDNYTASLPYIQQLESQFPCYFEFGLISNYGDEVAVPGPNVGRTGSFFYIIK